MTEQSDLLAALGDGDPQKVAALIERGADIRYKRAHGYDALLDAVHGRDILQDTRLIDLLELLIANRVDLNGVSSYQESGLRVLSRLGRFDAVRLLLDAGADRSHLGWTPLMEAVALGTPEEVKRLVDGSASLEDRDWWQRTPWLIALLRGDVAKAEFLLEQGCDPGVSGRCGQPPLAYAIEGRHPDMVRWLLDQGADVNQADVFGITPLMFAAEAGDAACVDILIRAGAEIDRDVNGTALNRARTAATVKRLLDAGADPHNLSSEGHRAAVGLPPDPDAALVTASADDFTRARTRRFGNANPERIDEPFWHSMIRSGITGYGAGELFEPSSGIPREPRWCARRFGQSLTFVPDGRIVQIAGEHEDHYDPDFCIYNDVFVHQPDGAITVFGYPEAVFPPTDFHTATLVGDRIYVIGSLGYEGARQLGQTPIFRLDLTTFEMVRLEARGDPPSWIYQHRAELVSPRQIRVKGGTIVKRRADGDESHEANAETFVLDLDRLEWRRESGG